ncbi:hypothetical protein Dimus_039255 [Dionaea muscipula]
MQFTLSIDDGFGGLRALILADTITEIRRLSTVRESLDDIYRVVDETEREIAAHSSVTLQFSVREQHFRPKQNEDEMDQSKGHGRGCERGRGRARARGRGRASDNHIGATDAQSYDQTSAADPQPYYQV